MPSHSSPSVKLASIPLIRGDPSRRSVASSLCLWASKVARALAASSGAAASISLQLAMGGVYDPGGTNSSLDNSGVVGDCVAIPSWGSAMTETRAPAGADRPADAGRGEAAPAADRHGPDREEAAESIRASEWKIHRLENGQVGFKERDMVDLLRLYAVTDPGEVAEFLALAREANAPGWWQHYGTCCPSGSDLCGPGVGRVADPDLRGPVRARLAPDRRVHAGGGAGAHLEDSGRRWAGGCGCAWPARRC